MTLDPPLDAGGLVRRLADRPIVGAGAVRGYGPIFNAGVIHHDGLYHLFARGVRAGYRRNDGPGARFLDYVSDVLVFTSEDGHRYAFQQSLAIGSDDGVHCYEDPRVQRVRTPDGEAVVMTYTHLPPPESDRPWRVGCDRLVYADGRFALQATSTGPIGPPDVADKDAVMFNLRDGRLAYIHRVHPNIQLAVFDSLDDLIDPADGYWDDHLRRLEEHTILRPSPGALGIGAGAPPVATRAGFLLFFHEREANGHYTVKVALLDDGTGEVVAVLAEPIMRPLLEWECSGDVDNVVFVQGAVPRADGTIYLTYGASDRHVGAATVRTADLLSLLASAA
jgi:predicted GH43/DUF377 family glycosyl hydrolase